ncbi:extracellular solute-binding protein, partial [Acinetobacter baumannii]
FFPFPAMDTNNDGFEEVSINGVGIPSGAKNKELALKFLAVLAQPDNLAAFAKAGAVSPARTDVALEDAFSQVQMKLAQAAK